jgi:membrane-associated phospholipid phosphatase
VHVAAARRTSAGAAATQAAYQVATTLFPQQKALLDAALREGLSAVPDGRARALGVQLGRRVGDAIVALRANDGSEASIPYTPGSGPGAWVPTPPAFAPALLPQWPRVLPFGIASGTQFRPAGPPDLASAQCAAEVSQVQALGSKTSSVRTQEQTDIALFWADGARTVTPPGHWNLIAERASLQDRKGLVFNARLFALLDVAVADAGIVAWDAKYTYNLWRPVTVIHAAADDGNPGTTPDPSWQPLLVTPPFPSYISGHSTFSGAASTVLDALFGSDRAVTVLPDPSVGLPPRQFASFDQAAEEAGISRIYGGIHFSSDNIDGLAAGRNVGRYILAHVGRTTKG